MDMSQVTNNDNMFSGATAMTHPVPKYDEIHDY